VMMLVFDFPRSMTYVNQDAITKSGVAAEEWAERALENLLDRSPPECLSRFDEEHTLMLVKQNDAYDAARALVLHELRPDEPAGVLGGTAVAGRAAGRAGESARGAGAAPVPGACGVDEQERPVRDQRPGVLGASRRVVPCGGQVRERPPFFGRTGGARRNPRRDGASPRRRQRGRGGRQGGRMSTTP